jgi:NADH-quinone oxidoreductase subunit J
VSGLEIVFGAFAVLAVASGLLAVTSPKVVHCALWLVVSLGSVAGVYLVLGAEVVALVQLLVYVGAVVVLVLFALMLTRAPIAASRDLDAGPAQRVAAAVAAVAVAGVVGGTLMVVVGDTVIGVDSGRGDPRSVGAAIFGGWLLPFELLSVLLLAALVAALAISRDDDAPEPVRPTPEDEP